MLSQVEKKPKVLVKPKVEEEKKKKPHHHVMRRVMNYLINPQSRQMHDEFVADTELLDTIDRQPRAARPKRPARPRWPPDNKTCEWLCGVLDAEMRQDLERRWEKIEDRMGRSEDPPMSDDEFRWLQAHSSGDRNAMRELVREGVPAPLWMQAELAGRGRGRPRSTGGQRAARSPLWLAEKDFRRLKELLTDLYRDDDRAKKRDRRSEEEKKKDTKVAAISAVAMPIAARRWLEDDKKSDNKKRLLTAEEKLATYIRKSRKRRVNPPV